MENLVEIENLKVEYKTRGNVFGKEHTIHAINGLSLNIQKGEILSIAGESGCGKSTLAKALMKLVEVKDGKILVNGFDIFKLQSRKDIKNFYKNVQMIFQNPYSSLNPKMRIGEILSEPLKINTDYTSAEITKVISETLAKTGLDESCLDSYPHEFSGGQRQRIAIARSLVLNPKFIIADEPVSALDVSIQAQIINLLKQLKQDYNLTILFISHDLGVIRYISDRIAVMYLGEIVETGMTEEIFENPKHPYTKALLGSVPELNNKNTKERIKLEGELPSAQNLPNGCKFHTRCPYVKDICRLQNPYYTEFSQTHNCKCFLYN